MLNSGLNSGSWASVVDLFSFGWAFCVDLCSLVVTVVDLRSPRWAFSAELDTLVVCGVDLNTLAVVDVDLDLSRSGVDLNPLGWVCVVFLNSCWTSVVDFNLAEIG